VSTYRTPSLERSPNKLAHTRATIAHAFTV
jgi:hypothetical protein